MAESETVKISNTDGASSTPQLIVKGENVYVVWKDESPGNSEIFFSKSTDGGITFEDPSNLSNNLGLSAWPRFIVSEEKIYTIWYDYSPCKSDIFFSKGLVDGGTFDTINLSNNTGVSYNPWIAYSNEIIYVVWNDSTNPDGSLQAGEPECQEGFDATTHMDIIFARSDDEGASFDSINLSNSSFSWNPRIVVSESNVFIVWNQKTISGSDIFFSMSKDNGISFSRPINLTNSIDTSSSAGIQVLGKNVYIVWNESTEDKTDIFFSKSTDFGKTFGSTVNLSNSKTNSLISRDTQMVVNGNNVYIVWYDSSPEDSPTEEYGVYFIRSIDEGNSFSQPINLSDGKNNVAYAQIVADDQKISVIWNEVGDENLEIFLRQSNNGGEIFGSMINLSKEPSDSVLSPLGPQVAISNYMIYSIWESIGSNGSNLFLNVQSQDLQQDAEKLFLQTTNVAVNIEVNFEQEHLETDQPIKFSLRFVNPLTNLQLENVNYSISIFDTAGNVIFNELNQHSEGSRKKDVVGEKT